MLREGEELFPCVVALHERKKDKKDNNQKENSIYIIFLMLREGEELFPWVAALHARPKQH